jgi:hypothetical protein
MRLLNVNGKLINKNVKKYLINWEGKSRSKLQFQFKQFFFYIGKIILSMRSFQFMELCLKSIY